MTLGLSRTRNYGREVQASRLAIAMLRGRVVYRVKSCQAGYKTLYLAASANGMTAPFDHVANLFNTERGRWEARSIFSDAVLATGISKTDVIAKTIEAVWH